MMTTKKTMNPVPMFGSKCPHCRQQMDVAATCEDCKHWSVSPSCLMGRTGTRLCKEFKANKKGVFFA